MAKDVMKIILGIALRFVVFFLFPIFIIVEALMLLPLLRIEIDVNFMMSVVSILIFSIVYFVYKKIFGFYSVQIDRKNVVKYDCMYSALFVLFMILYSAVLFIAKKLDVQFEKSSLLPRIAFNIAIGFTEEVFFRGILVSYLEKKLNTNVLILFISSLLFAVFHFVNLTFESFELSDALLQVFITFCTGSFWGSLYIMTGKLWLCMLLHSLWNIFADLSPLLVGYMLFAVFACAFAYVVIAKNAKIKEFMSRFCRQKTQSF